MTLAAGGRTGSELIQASRSFAEEDPKRTWAAFVQTVAATVAALVFTFWPKFWPTQVLASLILGLLVVRWFIFYHDTLHGAIFRKSRVGKAIMWCYGLLVLTPRTVWRDSHNYHHAHTSKLVGSSIGSFTIHSRAMYEAEGRWGRWAYRVSRHWLVMILGYFFIFMISFCVKPFVQKPRRNWEAPVSLGVHLGLMFGLAAMFGWAQALLTYGLPVFAACAVGSYLFYAQHNFPAAKLRSRAEWEYTAAALYSSSMIDMSPWMHWFTGNIGYHHVHHLNSMIPFYRLPEAMDAIPELRHPGRTSLSLAEIRACLSLQLWDAEAGRMIRMNELDGALPSAPVEAHGQ